MKQVPNRVGSDTGWIYEHSENKIYMVYTNFISMKSTMYTSLTYLMCIVIYFIF